MQRGKNQRKGRSPLSCHTVSRNIHIKVIHTKLGVTLKLNTSIIKNNDHYLACIPRLALPTEFLNDSNDSKLTMLGGRLFPTLIIRSLRSQPRKSRIKPACFILNNTAESIQETSTGRQWYRPLRNPHRALFVGGNSSIYTRNNT